ncbi:MAG: hypothetical protein CL829_01325 [Crocinitomicaceae bacterium]|nr:hypothetical protein [Crocinitomicaceae bacterium]
MSSSPSRPSVERLQSAQAIDEAIVLMSRANQDPQLCRRLLEGHKRVLEAYGIKNLSSFRTDWFRRDDVLVIAVLTPDGERVLAGARMHPGMVANDFPLHQAVGHMDEKVGNFMEDILPDGAYELNALWNSIELAGMGMGSEFLIQVAMAAMPLLGAKHLVALTSPVTRRWRERHGWRLRSELGDDGYFIYPTDSLRASIEHYKHPEYQGQVAPDVEALMTGIRERPQDVTTHVNGPKGQLKIRLNLTI